MSLEEIRQTCDQYDLRLRDFSLKGGLLSLVPDDLNALPDAPRLQALAEALRDDDIRWVTLVIEDAS